MLDIRLFGPMHLGHAGRSIGRPARRDVRLVLAYLLLHRDHEVARHSVASAIWPHAADRLALGRLRRGLHRVLTELPPEGGQPWIQRMGRALQWNPNASYRLDLEVFESICSRTLRPGIGHDPVRVRDDLTTALDLMRGALLEGDEEDWIAIERERIEQRYIQLLDRLAEVAEVLGDPDAAITATTRLLELEPLREDSHRRLMRLHFRRGDVATSMRQYERCRLALRSELGLEPHARTEALMKSLRRGRISVEDVGDLADPLRPEEQSSATGAPDASAEGRTPAGRVGSDEARSGESDEQRGGVPWPPDRFFGRGAELAEGARRLVHDRFVVITGPPGSGKSRLAVEIATDPGSTARERVFWVDLAPCESAASALRLVGQTCAEPGTENLRGVSRALGGRSALLVLDNCEHLADVCAGIVNSLLWSTPELRVLATSRTPIATPASVTWRIGGLSAAAAAELFVDRARRAQADYAPHGSELEAVETVCSRLAGLPLAIELASAHVPTLSAGEILLELGDVPRLLRAGRPPGMARHESVCESVALSCRLLDPEDMRWLRSLCAETEVERFSRAHVERVGGGVGSRWAALHQLERLVEQSLIEPIATAGSATRYRVLEPIRACVRHGLAL